MTNQRMEILRELFGAVEAYLLEFIWSARTSGEASPKLAEKRERVIKVIDAAIDAAEADR